MHSYQFGYLYFRRKGLPFLIMTLLLILLNAWISILFVKDFRLSIDAFANLEQKIYSATDLQNIEIYDNYTLIHRTNNYYHLRVCYDTDFGGNWMDRNSVGYQHIVYSHYQKASICRLGVVSYDKFVEAGRHYYGPFNLTDLNHSLISYRKIIVGWSRYYEFGHFLQDMVCGIIAMPQEIQDDAEIYFCFPEPNAKAFMKYLGYNEDRVHRLTDELVFGHDVYIAVSDYGMNGLFQSWIELREIIFKQNKLYEIKPVDHVFVNKNVGNWGYAKNMMELFNLAKAQYPQYNWYYYDDAITRHIVEFGKIMAAAKLFISAAGSIVFNDYLMHNETGVLIISRKFCDNPAILTTLHYHMWCLALVGESVHPDGIVMNVTKFMAGLGDLIHAVYKGEWPNDIDSRTRLHFNFKKTDYFLKGEEMFKGKNTDNFMVLRYKNVTNRYKVIKTSRSLFKRFRRLFKKKP